MNTEAQRYLRRATRGLWGRRRREVREELAAHLEGRVTAYRIVGLSEDNATEKALAELGSPQIVSAGMARLYTLPTVMGSGLAVAAMSLAVMALLTKVLAQPEVGANFYWPTEACVKAQQMDALYGACEEFDTLWLEPQSFKTEMRRQGVELDEGGNLTLTFPNGAFVQIPTEPHELTTGDSATRTRRGVIAFSDVFRGLLSQPGSVWFEDWDNPVVHIGDVAFRVGTTKQLVTGEKFYDNVLGTVFFEEFSRGLAHPETTAWYVLDPLTDVSSTPVEVKLRQPGIYGVVTLVGRGQVRAAPWLPPARPGDVLLTFEAVRSDGSGNVTAQLPKNASFTTSFESAEKTNTAVMVRFADDASTDARGYSMVSPEDITLTARP